MPKFTSWQIDGETMETVKDFIFLGSKVTEDGDYSHEIKRHLLLGRKADQLRPQILKSRDITLSTKVHLIKVMVFPIVMYGWESWTTKKVECWKMMLLNCGVGARLLRVPWTARRANQSILKEISPEYSLEGLMLKLKLQYFGHLMQRADIGKDPDAGKDWRHKEKGMRENEMVRCHHQLNRHEFEQAPGVGDGQGSLACCSPWGHKESDTTERLNWVKCQKNGSLENKPKVVGMMWEHNSSSPIGKKFHGRDRNYDVKSFSRWHWSVIN